MRDWTAIVFLILVTGFPILAQEKDVEIVKSPAFILGSSGKETCFDVVIRIRPDSRNRKLATALLEGGGVLRVSEDQLEGENSKRRHDFRFCIRFTDVTELTVLAIVLRNDDTRVQDSARITVVQ